MDKLTSLLNRAVSRRKFVAGVGATAGATVVLGLNGCSGSGPTPTPTPTPTPIAFTDADVLNFALNLEYLEAQFYLYAATGSGLEASDLTPGSASKYQTVGTVTLGDAAAVPGLTPEQQDILNEIAYEEQEHVRFLRTALGSAAVPMPDIDLSFFGPLAVAAGITQNATGAGSFNPFDSFDDFLVGGFIFEDVGVTAYSGAAGLISPAGVTAGYLTAAAGILAIEAYHAGYIRTSLTGRAVAAGAGTTRNWKKPTWSRTCARCSQLATAQLLRPQVRLRRCWFCRQARLLQALSSLPIRPTPLALHALWIRFFTSSTVRQRSA